MVIEAGAVDQCIMGWYERQEVMRESIDHKTRRITLLTWGNCLLGTAKRQAAGEIWSKSNLICHDKQVHAHLRKGLSICRHCDV